MYNLEHLIHHQTLIRVAMEKEINIVLAESFGHVYMTLQYKNQCLIFILAANELVLLFFLRTFSNFFFK